MTQRTEAVWKSLKRTGGEDQASFYFWLNFLHLTKEQTARVRQQAMAVLKQHGKDRALIRNTFLTVVELADERLHRTPNSKPISTWLVQAVWDPTDPWQHVMDDRGWVLAFSRRLAEDPDPLVAALWGMVSEGFSLIHFSAPPKGTKWASDPE